ncbi:unnamed protein product [Pleuronectes platessa]|uniref:Uncharacterized protein n=1 Tax=Pleuronectes platessa TaxID=8262 RepID=A0A9N7YHB1_PLEPL|nr:unnamed protein product [Pleuronectes platessa]
MSTQTACVTAGFSPSPPSGTPTPLLPNLPIPPRAHYGESDDNVSEQLLQGRIRQETGGEPRTVRGSQRSGEAAKLTFKTTEKKRTGGAGPTTAALPALSTTCAVKCVAGERGFPPNAQNKRGNDSGIRSVKR